MKPSLIVHGGAWPIPEDAFASCKEGCRRALEAGWAVLSRGGNALEAVESAIVILEDDPVFDAGTGAHLNRDGKVELDAIVMDGATLQSGAVAVVQRVKNPIRLARRVMESCEHMMLAGEGAERFAQEQGIVFCDPAELIVPRERVAWEKCRKGKHDAANHVHQGGTVGAVAMDHTGHIVAGTSTGGTCCKRPGRIGDTPLIGCGCYADEKAGGVSCTGWGEAIMKIVMAKTAVDRLRVNEGKPKQVAESCIQLLAKRTKGTGGLILLDREGNPGAAFNTPHMAHGYIKPDGSLFTTV
ncbi:MAG TPA: isoaspartyl peptidase/L-asparaginase [Candidatus Acidoferrum sp.]|nr:isoaspartyl peptidase/L-asparaginase [Candidatus Acidoferrum sp.]